MFPKDYITKNFKVFYSWQSDTNFKLNRLFLDDVIKKALKQVSNKNYKLTLDHSANRTNSGSIDISETIFSKIEKCDIFIGDVTIINTNNNFKQINSRKTPNPNVLIELGYAASRLGWENIILVSNKKYGEPEDLPFDIRARRVFCYELSNEHDKLKFKKKKILINTLKDEIEAIIKITNSWENNPIVSVYVFVNNKILEIKRKIETEIEIIYKRTTDKFSKDNFNTANFKILCRGVRNQGPIEDFTEGKVIYKGWNEYVYAKNSRILELIVDILRIESKLSDELIGKILLLETSISGQIDMFKIEYGNENLEYLSLYLADHYFFILDIYNVFEKTYNEQLIEYRRQYITGKVRPNL